MHAALIIIILSLLNIYNIANAAFYAQITDLKSGALHTYPNSNDHFVMFGSSQKIFTAFTAFNILGEDFQFETKIQKNGIIKNGVLFGDIIIKFDGNPDLNDTHFLYIAQKIKALGITEIKGSVILDVSEFDSQIYPHGSTIENQNMCYNAPFSAAIIDKNCSMISIQNESKQLFAESKDNFVQIHSEALYDPKICDLDLSYQHDNHYLLTGKCNIQNEMKFKIAVRSPLLLSKHLVKENLNIAKIKYKKVYISSVSYAQETQFLFSIKSRPLWAIMKDVLIKSDNLLSEALIKKIGSLNGEGSWNRGLSVMHLFLQRQLGISSEKITMADGSGLSRKNLFHLDAFSLMLNKLALMNYHTSLYNSLSTAQSCKIDTNNQYIINNLIPIHYRGFPLNHIDANRVLIKTGGLDGVRAVAGYFFDCSGTPIYSIVGLINTSYLQKNKNLNSELAKRLEDIICNLDQKHCFNPN